MYIRILSCNTLELSKSEDGCQILIYEIGCIRDRRCVFFVIIKAGSIIKPATSNKRTEVNTKLRGSLVLSRSTQQYNVLPVNGIQS